MDKIIPVRIDALLPREMAEKAERLGVEKTRIDAYQLLALALLAGVFIGFGSLFWTVVMAGSESALSYGVARLLGGVAFSTGLILVIVGGAELFTGNNLMVMACASGKVGVAEVLRAWGLVYVGNFVGSVALASLVFVAGGYSHGGGAVGAVALASAEAKVSFSMLQALVHGFLANVLVCLAVWLCYSARTTTDKILAIVPPVTAFVAAGFEHSIANMYLLSFALLTKFGAPASFWHSISQTQASFSQLSWMSSIASLLWVTIGNMIGGALVGMTYWFIYLRKPGPR